MTRKVELPPGLAAKRDDDESASLVATEDVEPGDDAGEASDEASALASELATWIPTEQAAAEFGVSKRKLQRAAKSGDVRTTRVGRTLLFHPDDVASLSPDRPLVDQATSMIAQLQRHHEQMFQLYARPLEQFLRHNAEHVDKLQARIGELEKQRDEARASIEAAESAEADRAIAMLEAEGRVEMKRDAWAALKANAPAILALLGARKPGVAESTLAAGVGLLVDSLTPEQLAEIAKSLTPPQVHALKNLVDARREAAKTTAEKSATDEGAKELPSEGNGST